MGGHSLKEIWFSALEVIEAACLPWDREHMAQVFGPRGGATVEALAQSGAVRLQARIDCLIGLLQEDSQREFAVRCGAEAARGHAPRPTTEQFRLSVLARMDARRRRPVAAARLASRSAIWSHASAGELGTKMWRDNAISEAGRQIKDLIRLHRLHNERSKQ